VVAGIEAPLWTAAFTTASILLPQLYFPGRSASETGFARSVPLREGTRASLRGVVLPREPERAERRVDRHPIVRLEPKRGGRIDGGKSGWWKRGAMGLKNQGYDKCHTDRE
jgi:hypothetical protein